jgi:hypothetical protein
MHSGRFSYRRKVFHSYGKRSEAHASAGFQNASFPEELISLSFTLLKLAPDIRICGDLKRDHLL